MAFLFQVHLSDYSIQKKKQRKRWLISGWQWLNGMHALQLASGAETERFSAEETSAACLACRARLGVPHLIACPPWPVGTLPHSQPHNVQCGANCKERRGGASCLEDGACTADRPVDCGACVCACVTAAAACGCGHGGRGRGCGDVERGARGLPTAMHRPCGRFSLLPSVLAADEASMQMPGGALVHAVGRGRGALQAAGSRAPHYTTSPRRRSTHPPRRTPDAPVLLPTWPCCPLLP